MKTGEAITRLLAGYGVEHVFGIPGTHSLELYRGLAGDARISHVLAHHEQGAGFMADGYARSGGRPGVCFVITGAGVTNITTPLGESYMDSVPVLVVSPVNPPDGGGRNLGRLHEITDQAAVTAPLTAFSATAQSAAEVPQLIARAFSVFSSARPRPVHISVPLPILQQEVGAGWTPMRLPERSAAQTGAVEAAAAWIEEAERPIIVAGGGTRFCAADVVALAERVGCPVATTVAGRGVIPGSHPLCAGAQLRAEPVQALLGESDLAVLIGTELAQTDHWNDALPLPTRQIRINIDQGALVSAGDVLALLGDAGDAVQRLCAALPAERGSARRGDSERRCAALRDQLPHSMNAKERRHWQVLSALRDTLPASARVFSDMTQIAYTAIDFMPMEAPNRWHHPTGYGTLGYALPAAIGSAVAEPGTPVVILVGDAGLQYTMQELPLAAELGLNLKLLLWNNDALEQISDDMNAAGFPPLAVAQHNPDFELLARACGWRYRRAAGVQSLGTLFTDEFQRSDCCLIQLDEHTLFGAR